MSKRLQINCRSNPYIEALIASMMEKEGMKKTDVIHRAIEYYAQQILDQEEIINIRLQQFENDTFIKHVESIRRDDELPFFFVKFKD